MAARQDRRRWAALTAGFATLAVTGLGPTAGPQRVSADTAPVPIASPLSLVASTAGRTPSVSGNGQFVVFAAAPGEADASGSRTSSVWLSDRLTGEITELTLPREGTRLGNSVNPVISADGCTALIATETAYDLFRDDDEGARWDIYRSTLPACGGKIGDWAIVSTLLSADGQAQARNDIDAEQTVAVSSSGSVVAYVRPFESLSGNDDPDLPAGAIDVVDLSIPIDSAGHTAPAPGLPTEAPGNGLDYVGQAGPALSADGSVLVFFSDATSDVAVADWVAPIGASTAVPTQVFAWNRDDADPFTAVVLMSGGSAGATVATGAGNASSVDPTVSADGSVVAFASAASNLVDAAALDQCTGSCPSQIYVVARDPDVNGINDEEGLSSTVLISQPASEAGSPVVIGNGASFAPAISGDGMSVAFSSQASNLLQVQTPGGGEIGDGDLLIADLANGTRLRRAFDSLTPTAGAHGRPQISANGRVVVADSLVAGELLANPELTGRHIVAATYTPALSIAALDLGTIAVLVPGPEWVVNVVNLGPGSFTPAEVTIDNPDFAISGGSCVNDRAPVQPGRACDVKIILTPTVAGPRLATLTVAEAGFGAIILAAPVKGAGGEPALDAVPDFADYGSEVVGTLSQFTEVFQVSNVSITPTAVASATLSGANPSDFIVTSSGCGGELTMALSCPVEVSFLPTGSGRRTATPRRRRPVRLPGLDPHRRRYCPWPR